MVSKFFLWNLPAGRHIPAVNWLGDELLGRNLCVVVCFASARHHNHLPALKPNRFRWLGDVQRYGDGHSVRHTVLPVAEAGVWHRFVQQCERRDQ